MRTLALILFAFLVLAFESPLLHQADVARFAPDLALVIALYAGLTSRFESGLLIAIVVGLLKDGFALGHPVGLYTEVSVLAYLVAHRASRRLALRGATGVMVLTAVFSIGSSLVVLVLSAIFDRTFGEGASGPGQVLAAMLPQALVTAPFGPVLFWLLDRLDGVTTQKSDSVLT